MGAWVGVSPLGAPGPQLHLLLQVVLLSFAPDGARVVNHLFLCFAVVALELAGDRVTRHAKVARDRGVGRRVAVHYVATFVVAAGSEVLTIGSDIQKELVVKRVLVEQARQVTLHVVSNLCRVDGRRSRSIRAGSRAQIPQLHTEIVPGHNLVIIADELRARDLSCPLVEHARLVGFPVHVE